MANTSSSLPLYECIPLKYSIRRALELLILLLLISLLVYRLLRLKDYHDDDNDGVFIGFPWLLAFLCESWFTLIWLLTISTKWTPVDTKTYPDRLLQRYHELPPVDVFVTTADPVLEPPIITVNTVLSLLAVEYGANKLACYVSDDGCSPVTYYSLVEASKFAKLWVPFCKKYGIQVRAPFRYFDKYSDVPQAAGDPTAQFRQEWRKMKDNYGQLKGKIEAAPRELNSRALTGDFAVFSHVDRRNHPTIIKVILENKEGEAGGLELPHLVYVSREKRPKHHHHFKAGAMNVLTRVSAVMTNAPFMLNVDCDMFANNPLIILHAMCLLLGGKVVYGFVQSPQVFYDGLEDDPFGNQLIVLHKGLARGIAGIQGFFYAGTGCFHRRKVIYGLLPEDVVEQHDNLISENGKLTGPDVEQKFGHSKEFIKSTAQTLMGSNEKITAKCPLDISGSLEAASQVAACGYEYGTQWGNNVGWAYGSATEDILTGMKIHSRGWRSVSCIPDPPAFLGCAPNSGPATMIQMKRWATGLLEILLSANNPFIATLVGKLQFRQCLAYLWVMLWPLRSIPEMCYAVLPAYCIATNSSFLPQVEEAAMVIPAALFVVYNIYTLSEYLQYGLSIRSWWNNQRMTRISSASAWLFGALTVALKLLGLTESAFEITQKDQSADDENLSRDAGKFTFDESPIFIPATTLLLLHLIVLGVGILGFRPLEARFGEAAVSLWVVLSFLPFLKGLFRKGKYGIPSSTVLKSLALALLFLHFCLKKGRGT